MSKKQRHILIPILILIMLIGVGVMAYPLIAAKYADSVRSEVYADYEAVIAEQETSALDNIRADAIEHNRKLYKQEIAVSSSEEVQNSGYWDQLRVEGNDVMCYIRIPDIDLMLPVYHGIGEDALGLGCGHMPQTSLPVGGINTHSVISAHTGMVSSAMFSDLPLLEVGDRFFIDVLGETLTYEIYEIPEPVLPHEISRIQIKTGEDLCTLITCVPFGVNTHRLLVHGRRVLEPEAIPEPTEGMTATLPAENNFSIYASEYRSSVMIGIVIIAVTLVVAILFVCVYRIKRKVLLPASETNYESQHKEGS